jgi:hypothetical protein
MAVETTLSKELTGFQNRNHRFLSLLGQDSELDPTFLQVEHGISDISLREDVLVLVKFENRFPYAYFGKEFPGIERAFEYFAHVILQHLL